MLFISFSKCVQLDKIEVVLQMLKYVLNLFFVGLTHAHNSVLTSFVLTKEQYTIYSICSSLSDTISLLICSKKNNLFLYLKELTSHLMRNFHIQTNVMACLAASFKSS